LNPTWGEAFTIDFEGILPRGGTLSPLKIIVLDYDRASAISSADVDTLGKVTVPWTDAFAAEPRRVSLSLRQGSRLARLMSLHFGTYYILCIGHCAKRNTRGKEIHAAEGTAPLPQRGGAPERDRVH